MENTAGVSGVMFDVIDTLNGQAVTVTNVGGGLIDLDDSAQFLGSTVIISFFGRKDSICRPKDGHDKRSNSLSACVCVCICV